MKFGLRLDIIKPWLDKMEQEVKTLGSRMSNVNSKILHHDTRMMGIVTNASSLDARIFAQDTRINDIETEHWHDVKKQ